MVDVTSSVEAAALVSEAVVVALVTAVVAAAVDVDVHP